MVTLWHTQLQDTLDWLYDLEEKIALFLHGTFGIGKTFAIREFAKRMARKRRLEFSDKLEDIGDEKKFVLIVLPLHQFQPGDLQGIPFANADRTKTVYLPVGLLPTAGQGVIFFDELNLAAPMLLSNAYQLIEDRRLGFYTVPDGYMVIGAGNKNDDRGNTFDMPMPLNNRFIHAELNVPVVEDIEVDGVQVRGWVNDFAIPNKVDHRIINYLSYEKKYLYTYKPDVEVSEPTVATPRMWNKASATIKGIPDSAENLLLQYIGMTVGTGIAHEFVAWLKLSRKYDIKKIFAEGTVVAPKPVDQLFSLISAIVSHYAESKKPEMAVQLLNLAECFDKEYLCMILNQAKTVDEKFFNHIKALVPKKYTDLSNAVFPLLVKN